MQEVIVSIQKKYVSTFKGNMMGDISVEITTNPVNIACTISTSINGTMDCTIDEAKRLGKFWADVANSASMLAEGRSPRIARKTVDSEVSVGIV